MNDMFNFPTPSEMEAIRAERKRSGEVARLMSDDGDAPKAGGFYTVSKDFTGGDGSWCECFWEVLTINGPKVFVRIHDGGSRKIERFFTISDRAWYAADNAWAASEAGKA
jgi:hypothetical protein